MTLYLNDDIVPPKIHKNYYQCVSYKGYLCKAPAYPSVEGDHHGNLINVTIHPRPPNGLPVEYGIGSHHMNCPDKKSIIFRAIQDNAMEQTAVRGKTGKDLE